MPPLSDKELEERLAAAGTSLVQPPPSLDELLPLLDRIEELLSKVEQSPAKSMQAALSPLMKALVTEELLKHSDVDVKVGVASCISEITRITAPDAPYDDDKMKDVFQLIVSSFENLSDISSRSYEKRATILETVAKVRSCVIMLDLECDEMIIEMFQHFLKAIRAYHAEIIFASMETIMTLVLEESEEISTDLLSPILATLKRNNEAVMPIAKKLAERVIQNSADKLRPYLRQAVKSLDTSLDDYSEVVAFVCQENTDTVGHSSESVLKDQLVVEEKCTSASPAQDPIIPQAAKDGREGTNSQDKDHTRSPKSVVVSNGINETGTEEIITEANSSKRADSNRQLEAKSVSKTDSDELGAKKQVDSEAEVEHEAKQEPYNHETSDKDVHNSHTEVRPVEAAKSLDKQEDSTVQLLPSKAPENEAVIVVSPTQSGSHPEESRSETDILEKGKETLVSEEMISVDTASEKASEEESISEAKKQRRSGKKRTDDSADKDKALIEGVASENNDGYAGDSEERSPDQAEKPGDASNKTQFGSSMKKEDGKKGVSTKPTSEKDFPKSSVREDHGKDIVASRRSPLKSTKKEGIQEETPKTSNKRKRTPGKEKASETLEHGENLVGSKVKVWWPKDRMFYEGIIASFDPVKKKHKILYTDGDKEILNLRRERWEFIGDDMVSDGDQDVEHSSRDTSPDMQRKKKVNINSETASKRQKVEDSPKSKLKDTATKSGGKSKDDGKAESESKHSKPSKKSVDDTVKSKDQSQKLGGKGQVDSAKASGRSKDDAKFSSHSKQDSQKTSKSKGKNPQSGKTLGSGGTKMTKSSSSKVKENDRMKDKTADSAKTSEMAKGKSADTAKSRESEAKSGKKRRK